MKPTPSPSRLDLLLIAAAGEVSLDDLAEAGGLGPGALLSALERGRRDGRVAFDAERAVAWRTGGGDPGNEDDRTLEAGAAELEALVCNPAAIALFRRGAARAAAAGDLAVAQRLHHLLIHLPGPLRASFPGRERGWLELVVEAVRRFRSSRLVAPGVLDEAVEYAQSQGDLSAQALLLSVRAVRALEEDPALSRACLERSFEAADALADPRVIAEVRTYAAISLVLAGRPGEGIACFEALLGDGDVADPAGEAMLLDPQSVAPASALALLAHAYCSLGEFPRALELMGRVAARGAATGNRGLEAHGEVMLAVAFWMSGDLGPAGEHARRAAAWFEALGGPYAWACALVLARCALESSPAKAAAILGRAVPGWRAAGAHWVGGSWALELLERLERAGTPPDGLSLAGELERHLDAPAPLPAGIACCWKARLLLDTGDPAAQEEARALLVKAKTLLGEAGGGPELERARALEDRLEPAAAARPGIAGGRRESKTSERVDAWSVKTADLLEALLEAGHLPEIQEDRADPWDPLFVRLLGALKAERGMLVRRPRTGAPEPVAARGPVVWRSSVLQTLAAAPVGDPLGERPQMDAAAAAPGGLLRIPFHVADEAWLLVLENRWTAPSLGVADQRLIHLVQTQLEVVIGNAARWQEQVDTARRLERENRYHRLEGDSPAPASSRLAGDSPALREVLALVHRVAPTDTPVLVTGETGVGKELICRELHLASARSAGPFIAVHVASLSPGLVASALFGHERGAFTGATERVLGRFELAHGGTLFLDEVGELGPEEQVRLLRVLQEGTFERVGGNRVVRSDFRVVAATNRDLAAEVAAGRFREDLYYRLAAFPIRVPPLRERITEIPALALYFMEQAGRQLGLAYEGISQGDMERLTAHRWPGNVRELRHLIERAALLGTPPRLQIPELGNDPWSEKSPAARDPGGALTGAPPAQVPVSLREVQRRHIREVLQFTGGRISGPGGAAELLGLKPSTLHFQLDRLELRETLSSARRQRKTP